ncbi:MAG: phosphoribosylpyrophosphate synthetase [Bacteroidota bacterium]
MESQPPKSHAQSTDDLKDRGYTEDFQVIKEGLKAINSGKVYQEKDVKILEHHRFEGVSNPDDMSIVYGIETCDGTKGILSDAYGTYSDPVVANFITSVEKMSDSAEAGGHAASQESSQQKKVK